MQEFYPEVDRKNIPGFKIICPSFLGQYEARGFSNYCYLIWGYNVKQKIIVPKELSESTEDWSIKYKFPNDSRKMYVD